MLENEKGFTLIELIIVIVIIGTAIGLAAPRIGKSLEKMQLRTAVRKLAAVMRYTRQMAISRKKEYPVTIIADEDDQIYKYTYTKVERKKANNDPYSEKEEETQVSQNFTDDNIQEETKSVTLKNIKIYYQGSEDEYLEEGRSGEIIFYPKGESSGGKVILALEKIAFQINIDPVTGRVAVKRKNEDE